MINYRRKYINIYIWQILSIMSGFVSLFIVTPYISSNKILFGIYSLCISFTVYFSYADLGVSSAMAKYAAEYYISGNKRDEVKLVGFSMFIMLLTFSVVSLGLMLMALFPRLIIPELEYGSDSFVVARSLLLILALSSPIIILQRVLNSIFAIRVEDYKYQRFALIGNIIRILSVLYFFGNNRYEIVEYYFFCQIVNVILVLACFLYAKYVYDYSIRELISSFRFDKAIFDKIKKLCGVSFVGFLSTILFFELDQIAISQLLGIEAVAIYAIAMSIFSVVRMYNSIIFAPYSSRFNHFIGLHDTLGLVGFMNKLTYMTFPVVVIPIIVLSLLANPFVISWVGWQYQESSILVSFIICNFIVNFMSMPISSFLVATEKLQIMLYHSLIIPIAYWGGIIFTYHKWGVLSFAVFKAFAPVLATLYLIICIRKILYKLDLSFISLRWLLFNFVAVVIVAGSLCYFGEKLMIYEQSKFALAFNILIIGSCILVSLLIHLPFNSPLLLETRRLFVRAFYHKV